jgi:hypothetical protein
MNDLKLWAVFWCKKQNKWVAARNDVNSASKYGSMPKPGTECHLYTVAQEKADELNEQNLIK